MLASDEDENESWCVHAEMCEDDIFEWHFAIMGAEGSEFEGGIYHGRILLPPEYPFKPPSFMLLHTVGKVRDHDEDLPLHHPASPRALATLLERAHPRFWRSGRS